MYSEEDYLARPLFTEPEILRTNLAAVILQMKSARLGEIEQFPVRGTAGCARLIRDGYLTLHELNAVDDENELTQMGRHLGKLPTDPQGWKDDSGGGRRALFGRSVGDRGGAECAGPAESGRRNWRRWRTRRTGSSSTKAAISFRYLKVWEFFQEKVKNCSSSQLRKQCKNQFLSYMRLREWSEVHQQLHRVISEMGWKPNHKAASPDQIHRALLTGLLSNVGNKTDSAEYAGLRGAKFFIFPGSVLFSKKPPWLMSAEIVETQRLYARTNAKVLPEWIEAAAAHLIKKTYTDPHWNSQRGDVIAGERVSLKGLIIVPHRTVSYGPIDPRTAREVFIHHALVEGDYRGQGEYLKHNRKLVDDVLAAGGEDAAACTCWRRCRSGSGFLIRRWAEGIYNGHLFEKWRKSAERDDPRLLWMSSRRT